MVSGIMVLWLFFAQPWSFGQIPMTPGWASMHVFWDEEACMEAVARATSPAICLPAGSEDPEPVTQIDRGGETR